MSITPDMKVAELLEAYPQLEEVLIEQSPMFRKLRNPVLRRTAAKIATLGQAASMAGLSPATLVNTLRKAVGIADHTLDELTMMQEASGPASAEATSTNDAGDAVEPIAVFDADAMLAAGRMPLHEVRDALLASTPGDVVRLEASFRPAPMIEALELEPCTIAEKALPDGRQRVDFTRTAG